MFVHLHWVAWLLSFNPIALDRNTAQLVTSDNQIISTDAEDLTDYCAHTAMGEAIRDGLLDDMAVNELNKYFMLSSRL